MLIPGFAYTEQEYGESIRRRAVWHKLNDIGFQKCITVTTSIVEYAQHRYCGVIDLELFGHAITPEELLIWLDGWGLAPFGGVCNLDTKTGRFSATVYTD